MLEDRDRKSVELPHEFHLLSRVFAALGVSTHHSGDEDSTAAAEHRVAEFIARAALPDIYLDILRYEVVRLNILDQAAPRRPATVSRTTPFVRVAAAALTTSFPIGPLVRYEVDDPLTISRNSKVYLLAVLPYEKVRRTALVELEDAVLEGLLRGEPLDSLLPRSKDANALLRDLCELADLGIVRWTMPMRSDDSDRRDDTTVDGLRPNRSDW